MRRVKDSTARNLRNQLTEHQSTTTLRSIGVWSVFCAKCGTETPDDSQFCRKCGQALGAVPASGGAVAVAPAPVPIPAAKPKSKWSLGVFLVLLALILW